MNHCIVLFLLVGIIHNATSQLDGHFWWLPKPAKNVAITTSSTPSTTTETSSSHEPEAYFKRSDEEVCCECVAFYLCINGTISTDGSGLINLRIGGTPYKSPVVNVKECPDSGNDIEVCCSPPGVDPSCLDKIRSSTPSSPSTLITPHPESDCECQSYDECPSHLIVSNGLGNTSIELSDGRIVSHDKCHHALDVCCYLPDPAIFTDNITLATNSDIRADDDCPLCVPTQLCNSKGYVIEDYGQVNINLRSVGTYHKPCPYNSSLVCCHDENSSTTPSPSVGTSGYSTSSLATAPVPPARLCGTRNFQGVGTRILGFRGGQTQFGEFPWVATLLRQRTMGERGIKLFLGGASLIHKRVVLTAAHKIVGLALNELQIRLGDWDVASEKEILPHQDVLVEEAIIHPGFLPGPVLHNVALLILKEDAKIDNHIVPICPAPDLSDIDATSCVINGWGLNEFTNGDYQKLMKSVTLPLVNKKRCQALLRKTRLGNYFKLHSSFICAGGEEGMDACTGDGGGPLACKSISDPSQYFQVGITAWGIGCGTKDVPGVYADVTAHYEWIISEIKKRFPSSEFGGGITPRVD